MGKLTHERAPGIEVYFLEVTGEVAKEMLAKNTAGNRNISQPNVERYASDMITMDWIINGDTIKFSKEGELLDGQHRLTAIAESGEAQVLLIVWGLDKVAMATIDAGRKRTYGDILKMRGVTNHTLVAALASRVWHWDHGNYGTVHVARIENAQHTASIPSSAQKDVIMAKYEAAYGITFEAAAAFGHKASTRRKGLSSSTYALAWVILSGINKDLREQFFHEVLVESKSPKSGYPIVALHNRLSNVVKGDGLDNVDQLDMLFSVYNNWVKGKEMQFIRPPRPVKPSILEIPDGFEELA